MGESDESGYGDVHAPNYDALFGGRDDVDAVAGILHELADGGEALEFGVGTGRFALPLAARGTRVWGVDNSEAMLERLATKRAGEPVEPVRGSFVDVTVEAPIKLVYCVFSTLFLLPDQATQLACLRNAAAHLPLGGRLLIEMFVHDRTRFRDNQEIVALAVDDDSATFRLSTLEPNAQLIHIQKVGLAKAGVELLPNRLRFVYPSELDLMARLAGFEPEARWGGFSRAPFTATSGDLVAVYRKRAEGPF